MNTKNIMELINQGKAVYVHPKDSDAALRFLQEIESQGFMFEDGCKPTSKEIANLYRLFGDKKICYCGISGHMAYQSGGSNIVRIEY